MLRMRRRLACLPFCLFFLLGEGLVVSRTFNFPFTSFQSGLHHIHAPESFIEAHGLCAEGFCLERATDPVRVEDYHVVTLTYRTLLARMHARVFTNHPQLSHFLLMDARLRRRPLIMGQFRCARYGEIGHSINLRASRLQPCGSILDRLRWVPSNESVEASIRAAVALDRPMSLTTDQERALVAYRKRVLFGLGREWRPSC